MRTGISLLAGVALALATAFASTGAQASNLVVNGGFETGDFTGWTVNPVSYPMYIVANPVASGQFAAQIAGYAFGPDTLGQTITDVAGQSYKLTFSRWQDVALPNGFSVTWNGATVFSEVDVLVAGYQQFTLTVTGTGLDDLVFTAYNDPAFTYLDDVSLTTGVPEPTVWALMIGGFGLAGATLRRRRVTVAA